MKVVITRGNETVLSNESKNQKQYAPKNNYKASMKIEIVKGVNRPTPEEEVRELAQRARASAAKSWTTDTPEIEIKEEAPVQTPVPKAKPAKTSKSILKAPFPAPKAESEVQENKNIIGGDDLSDF